jgi:hypothetical protein
MLQHTRSHARTLAHAHPQAASRPRPRRCRRGHPGHPPRLAAEAQKARQHAEAKSTLMSQTRLVARSPRTAAGRLLALEGAHGAHGPRSHLRVPVGRRGRRQRALQQGVLTGRALTHLGSATPDSPPDGRQAARPPKRRRAARPTSPPTRRPSRQPRGAPQRGAPARRARGVQSAATLGTWAAVYPSPRAGACAARCRPPPPLRRGWTAAAAGGDCGGGSLPPPA